MKITPKKDETLELDKPKFEKLKLDRPTIKKDTKSEISEKTPLTKVKTRTAQKEVIPVEVERPYVSRPILREIVPTEPIYNRNSPDEIFEKIPRSILAKAKAVKPVKKIIHKEKGIPSEQAAVALVDEKGNDLVVLPWSVVSRTVL